MTAEEIVSSYKEAKDKQAQLTILVDLAQMPRSQIVGILHGIYVAQVIREVSACPGELSKHILRKLNRTRNL